MALDGYVAVIARGGRLAHLRHPEMGLACPTGRKLIRRGIPFVLAEPGVYPLCARCERLHRRPAVMAGAPGRTSSPCGVVMREILSDGGWHEIRELAVQGGAKVPPNKAMAWFQTQMAPQRSPGWSAVMSPREKIRRGRYNVAVRVISDWLTVGFVEADAPPRRKGRRVRLTQRPTLARDERGRIRGWM